jgi:hypothetical protein
MWDLEMPNMAQVILNFGEQSRCITRGKINLKSFFVEGFF